MNGCTELRQNGMHDMKKVLYMGDPRIKYNQSETNILSIVDKEPEFDNWFYNNFIHLITGNNAHWGGFLFGNGIVDDCPWLDGARFNRRFVQDDIISYIKDKIDKDIYVWMNVETVNIPIYETIIKFHDIFIYGYDDGQKKFYTADFFRDGHYERSLITYEELENGFKNMIHHKDSLGIQLIWKKEAGSYLNEYTDSSRMIKRGIEDYLSAKYPFSSYKYMERNELQNLKYGTAIYDVLNKYCHSLLDGSYSAQDYLLFDLLYQHKSIMYNRIGFIVEHNQTIADIDLETMERIKNHALIIRNMFLKYMIKGDADMLKVMIVKLKELQQCELLYLKKVLEIL